MPNIEIHGVPKPSAHKLFMKIADLFDNAEYEDEVVISKVSDEVLGLDGCPRPFLRVIFAKTDTHGSLRDCEERLLALNMDREIVIIEGFFPKKE